MVAEMLGSLSFEVSDDLAFANQNDFSPANDFSGFGDEEFGAPEEAQPAFVRGSVLDAFAAHSRVERASVSSHIAAIDSDDNGLYRLYRTR